MMGHLLARQCTNYDSQPFCRCPARVYSSGNASRCAHLLPFFLAHLQGSACHIDDIDQASLRRAVELDVVAD